MLSTERFVHLREGDLTSITDAKDSQNAVRILRSYLQERRVSQDF